MNKLVLKRILLISLLIITIVTVAIYGYYHQSNVEYTDYINTRDQSNDYDRLFDNSNLKTFTLSFEEEVFDGMISKMEEHFDLYGDYIDNTMYPIDLTYTDSESSFTIKEVGFRTKSSTTRNLLRTTDWQGRDVYHQTTFQLQFNETFEYSEGTNLKNILSSREVFNLEQLNFEYAQFYDGDYDEAMITQAFTHYLYQEAGVLSANASYGIVYLKIGEEIVNYGFFTIIETIDSEFLKNNFDGDIVSEYGDLYKVTDTMSEGTLDLEYDGLIGIDTEDNRFTYSLRNNTLNGLRRTHDDFIDFIEEINDFAYFEANYETIFDYDNFARYLAIAFLVGNTDDIRYNQNNYYLYFDINAGVVTYIPFDLDNTLGFGKHLDLSGNYGTNYSIYYNVTETNILVENFFKVDDLSALYENYLLLFIDQFFNYNSFYSMYIEAKDLYEFILEDEFHLGNKTFDLRNIEWYFTQKIDSVSTELQ